jgi:hypothetical protein
MHSSRAVVNRLLDPNIGQQVILLKDSKRLVASDVESPQTLVFSSDSSLYVCEL